MVGPTVEVVRAALAGGVDVIQLRDKDVETAEMVEDALRVLELTTQANVPLIVNDRVDVALALHAEGAHVGQTDLPAPMARKLLAPPYILGVSTSTAEMGAARASRWRRLHWLWPDLPDHDKSHAGLAARAGASLHRTANRAYSRCGPRWHLAGQYCRGRRCRS